AFAIGVKNAIASKKSRLLGSYGIRSYCMRGIGLAYHLLANLPRNFFVFGIATQAICRSRVFTRPRFGFGIYWYSPPEPSPGLDYPSLLRIRRQPRATPTPRPIRRSGDNGPIWILGKRASNSIRRPGKNSCRSCRGIACCPVGF